MYINLKELVDAMDTCTLYCQWILYMYMCMFIYSVSWC